MSPTSQCHQHNCRPEKSMELCERLTSGDLHESYLHDVVYHDYDSLSEKDSMMTVVNIMCGNIDFECVHASYQYTLTANTDPGKFLF